MGEVVVSADSTPLHIFGLGSCIAVCMYDIKNKIGGMAHVMLPDSPSNKGTTKNPKKYAYVAIDELLKMLEAKGCKKKNIKVKIAGGSKMFSTKGISIADKNIKSVKKKLLLEGIPIVAEDTGGNEGRKVIFFPDTGKVKVKTKSKERDI